MPMSDLTALYLRTLVIGVAVAAPVGAMGVLCIQRVLNGGWRAGLSTGAGIATADGIYAGLAAFGVTAASSALVSWQTPVRLVGGACLLVLGVRSVLRVPSTDDCAADAFSDSGSEATSTSASVHRGNYASAVALTLTNPATIIAFGAILASSGLSAQQGPLPAAVATAGVASGSLAWWLVLSGMVAAVRGGVSQRFITWVSRVSGLVIAGFGFASIISAVL